MAWRSPFVVGRGDVAPLQILWIRVIIRINVILRRVIVLFLLWIYPEWQSRARAWWWGQIPILARFPHLKKFIRVKRVNLFESLTVLLLDLNALLTRLLENQALHLSSRSLELPKRVIEQKAAVASHILYSHHSLDCIAERRCFTLKWVCVIRPERASDWPEKALLFIRYGLWWLDAFRCLR